MKIKLLVSIIAINLSAQFSSPAQTLIGFKAGLLNSNLNTVFRPGVVLSDDFKENKSGFSASIFLQKYLSKKLSLELNF